MHKERLRELYGPHPGELAAVELEALLARFRPRLSRLQRSGNQEDSGRPRAGNQALLITYGDTLHMPERPALNALKEFAVRHLQGLVSGIHLLPFFPYSSDYGFSVTEYLAVRPDIGSWADVEALHADFQLMFDFVLNHVSAKSDWFQGFLEGEAPYRDFFITIDPATDLSLVTRPRTSPLLTRFETSLGPRWVWTTFGPDQVDLDYSNPQVLLRMLEVMLSYVEHGAELLRMDAVAYLWKQPGTSCVHLPQTHQLVKLFRDVLDEVAPQVGIVTETNVPHRDNVSYFGDGLDEAQMVYQFSLAPLVLDAFAGGDTGRLTAWAKSLSTPSDQTAFFNFLASHDGIGVTPARGLLPDADIDRLARRVLANGGEVSDKANPDGTASPYELNATFFDALADPNDQVEAWTTKLHRYICSQAIMLALAGVPGIYIHSLFGSHNDHAGFAQSGWKRDLNHQRLELTEVESRLSDATTEAAQVFAQYTRLLEVRCGQPAFHHRSGQRVLETGSGVFALVRGPWEEQVLVTLHNVTNSPQIAMAEWAAGGGGEWEDVISGERFDPASVLQLAPYQVLWLQRLRP